MSSTPPVPKRSSQRKAPVREALREKSHSETNGIPSRRARELRDESRPSVYDALPYPTKPSQVLLPSTIRRQQYGLGEENVLPRVFSPELRPLGSAGSLHGRNRDSLTERPRTGHAPTLTLKRSVAALRDMYEAQAEKSRPSTALSPPLRPSTAGSRPRTQSSSDGFSGPSVWDLHSKVSSDDLALLPSLNDMATRKFSLRKIPSSSSLENATSFEAGSPLPNQGTSSSDPVLVPDDYSDAPSSPNFVQLGRSCSIDDTPERTSSPNVVKLGTSSTPITGSSPQTIRKRKREDTMTGPSFAERTGTANPYTLSPTREASLASSSAGVPSPGDAIVMPSSPPRPASIDSRMESEEGSASRGLPSPGPRSDASSVAGTHTDLQTVLTSSPGPSVQYPVVRAPSADPMMISIPKRLSRTLRDRNLFKWSNRLSTVPSEFSEGLSKTNSKNSSFVVEEHDLADTSSGPTGATMYHATTEEAGSSQVGIVSMIEADQHEGEAGDYVSALPNTEHRPPITPKRSSSFLGTGSSSSNSRLNSFRNSVDHRLNSMKSFTNSWAGSRHDSMRSSHRPSSSSSVMSSFQLPAWAQRYYSGGYRDSFQYLYSGSTTHVDLTHSRGPAPRPATGKSQRSVYHPHSNRPDTGTSSRSIVERTKDFLTPKTRPRLEARKSHLEPGIGPLVSHPVRPPTASLRPVSLSLDPSDPRAHWAGAEEEAIREAEAGEGIYPQRYRGLVPSTWSRSPHLHRDDRAEFRGSRWKAPSIDESQQPLFSKRNAQVACFVLGFVFPIAWFVAAFLPLPSRPSEDDLEKTDATEHFLDARRKRRVAVVEELTWENASWWRMLNRSMCAVGFVVVVMVIVLAAVGTARKW